MNSNDQLAKAWVQLQYQDIGSEAYENLFWSFDAMADLASDDPEKCWQVILSIIEFDASDKVLSNLGAGPVEDLLCNHGKVAIEWIERSTAESPVVKKILGCVWKNNIPEDTWKKIQRVAASSW